MNWMLNEDSSADLGIERSFVVLFVSGQHNSHLIHRASVYTDNMPKFSIVVPFHNEEENVTLCMLA